jgi:hypothetical protein
MNLISLTSEQKEEHQKWKTVFETKYGFHFLNPNYELVPFVSNLMENQRAKTSFERIEYYLIGTYAIDMNSNNHMDMHKMRHQFTKEEYKWHQMHNKLGVNKWGCVAGIMLESLNSNLQRNDLHIVLKFPSTETYSQMSFNEKIEYVKSIDQKLYSLLETIYPQYQ